MHRVALNVGSKARIYILFIWEMIQREGLRDQKEGNRQGGKANLKVLLRLSLLAVGLDYASTSRKKRQRMLLRDVHLKENRQEY